MLDRLRAALADRYTVDRELGRGGMASVWLARDLRHDRPVAIKVLHPDLAGAIGVDRFLREIRLTARLQHPNVIPVLDSGTIAGPDGHPLPWYAMAYVAGESLRARLDREQQLPVDDALRIVDDAAAALEAAHREGIVHRDIKPENLLLAGGRTYVADFGIARALIETGSERLTSTGLSIGTPVYMSPEQAGGQTVDARSDQYSLACVLYEMLAGEPPFTGPTAQAILARRLSEPARAIRPVRPAVPIGIERAVLRALDRVPADRFPDVTAFAEALRRPSAPERPHRRRWIGAAGVLLVAAALGAWLLAQRRPAQRSRDPAIVALYRRGLHGYEQRTPAGSDEAVRAFSAAVARDSSYADAWAGLAKVYVAAHVRGFMPGVPRDSLVRLAVTASGRALAADSRSADAWATQAAVSRMVDPTDVTPAIRSARRALALDSTNASAWHFLALSLAEQGDMDGALQGWRRAIAAHPSYLLGLAFYSQGLFWRRQYDSAAYWADSAVALDPTYLLGRTALGYAAVERGDYARAQAAFAASTRLTTDVEALNTTAGLALAEARAGNRAEARRLIQRAESGAAAYAPLPLHTAVYLATAYAGLGDATRAVAWLDRYAVRDDLHFQLHLRCDPNLAPIERDPRFRKLLLKPRPAAGGC
jgi:tetratricopeptide (TPR) repeat protein